VHLERGEREQEVLRHASGMLSTAEIAMEMFRSINMVKSPEERLPQA
jgi:DNA-binding CsgD family transcriptional regulator